MATFSKDHDEAVRLRAEKYDFVHKLYASCGDRAPHHFVKAVADDFNRYEILATKYNLIAELYYDHTGRDFGCVTGDCASNVLRIELIRYLLNPTNTFERPNRRADITPVSLERGIALFKNILQTQRVLKENNYEPAESLFFELIDATTPSAYYYMDYDYNGVKNYVLFAVHF